MIWSLQLNIDDRLRTTNIIRIICFILPLVRVGAREIIHVPLHSWHTEVTSFTVCRVLSLQVSVCVRTEYIKWVHEIFRAYWLEILVPRHWVRYIMKSSRNSPNVVFNSLSWVSCATNADFIVSTRESNFSWDIDDSVWCIDDSVWSRVFNNLVEMRYRLQILHFASPLILASRMSRSCDSVRIVFFM